MAVALRWTLNCIITEILDHRNALSVSVVYKVKRAGGSIVPCDAPVEIEHWERSQTENE